MSAHRCCAWSHSLELLCLLARLADASGASVIGSPALTQLPARRSSQSHTLPFNLWFLRTSSRRASRLLNALRINLRRLFASLCGIDDEFEWIRVLILFHQFQIREALRTFESFTVRKLWLGRFEQFGCHCIFPVCVKPVFSLDNGRHRESKIVSHKFRAIHPARMSQPLKVRLPVPDILIVDSVDHMLAQDVVWLMHIRLMGQEVRRDEICLMNGGALVTTANSR